MKDDGIFSPENWKKSYNDLFKSENDLLWSENDLFKSQIECVWSENDLFESNMTFYGLKITFLSVKLTFFSFKESAMGGVKRAISEKLHLTYEIHKSNEI